MSDLLTGLGIDGKLLFAQALNFGLVLLILWRFAYRPILKVLDERRERIAKAERDVAAAAKARTEAEAGRHVAIATARREATGILAEAHAAAEATRASAVTEAQQERVRILATAAADAAAEKERALASAKGEVAELVVLAAGKVLAVEVSDTQHHKLVEQALREIGR